MKRKKAETDYNQLPPEDLNAEIRRLRDALKEIAQLGGYYTRTPYDVCIARKALGCKHMPYMDMDNWQWIGKPI